MASKIDQMKVGAIVLQLRKDLTCSEVADIVNQKYLPAGMEPINATTVSRYCVDNGIIDMERNGPAPMRFDALDEAHKNKKRLVRQINKMEKVLDDLKADEEKLSEYASISNAYSALIMKNAELDQTISKIQAEQLKVGKIKTCLRTLVKVLDKYPQVKADFFKELRETDEFDMIRSL